MTPPVTVLPDDAYNQALVANVHPVDWPNPEPRNRYNLVVIGAGTAGLVCAAGAAGLGARVALIERHLLGGDCLNTGCVPSKALIRAARAAHEARTGAVYGLRPDPESAPPDFAAIMTRMRRLRAEISRHDSARRFRDQLGVDVFLGEGRFAGADCIEVAGRQLTFHRAALCTGARAALPDIPGLSAAEPLTNETLFTLTSLPRRLAVLGGGPVGCEMAQAFARFGSRVTLVQRGPQLLAREDSEAAALLATVFAREGIEVRLHSRVMAVRIENGERVLDIDGQGGADQLRVDAILVAAGRAPNVEGLGLEVAGIDFDRHGVRVDDRLQTTNPRVFAAGDLCSAFKFTHAADAQARILLANALFPGRQKVSRLVIPWCTFTDPEIAHVGLTAAQAEARGMKTTTLTVALAEVDRCVLDGESEGFARVHLRRGTDTILGATIVGRHAGEMIAELALAMTAGLGLGVIGRTIHPYPTRTEAVRKLADAWSRTRLTPTLRRLFAGWLAWRRW